MTLQDFLRVCSPDDYVGVHNIDVPWSPDRKSKSAKRFETIPTQQQYMKVGNIPYGRIRHYLDKEVCLVKRNEKGYYIQIHTAGKAKGHLEQRELARLIGEELRGGKR